MAEARQNEMKVSITVVATKTFTAGFVLSGAVDMLLMNGRLQSRLNPMKIAQEAAKAFQQGLSGYFWRVVYGVLCFFGAKYVCVIRSCQQRASSSRKTHR